MSIKEWERTGLDSPSTTTCPQDDDVTLIHVKVDVHKYRISFWPETGEVLHSNQRSHGFSHRSHADGTKRLTQSSFSRNGPGYRLSRRRGVMQSISLSINRQIVDGLKMWLSRWGYHPHLLGCQACAL